MRVDLIVSVVTMILKKGENFNAVFRECRHTPVEAMPFSVLYFVTQ